MISVVQDRSASSTETPASLSRSTLVIVSHEMSFARALAHRVHFVFGGKVEESGTPEELFQAPKSDALKAFINSIQH